MTKRKSKGDGSVYKRKDGRWVGKYSATMPTGETKTRYVYARTRKDAAARLRAALGERGNGLVYDDGTLTVGEFLNKWLSSVRDTIKDRTYERNEEIVRLHLAPHIGSMRLSKLDAMRVQTLYRAKLDSGLSANSSQGTPASREVASGGTQRIRGRTDTNSPGKSLLPTVSRCSGALPT